jgi:hypothetical protein
MVRRANVDQAMDMRAAALCLAALAACGGGLGELAEPAGPALADDPAPAEVVDPLVAIHAGEQMRFEVRLAGVLAGEASFTTVALSDADGAPTATLTSSIRSAGALALVKDVRDEATTVLDVGALRPLSTTSAVRANPRDYTAETRFAGAKVARSTSTPARGRRSTSTTTSAGRPPTTPTARWRRCACGRPRPARSARCGCSAVAGSGRSS